MRTGSQLAMGLVVSIGLCLGSGCGDEREHAQASPHTTARDAAAEASARVEAFVAAPGWGGLIELLAQRHSVARELLGPHRLHYEATLTTGPVGLDPASPLPSVKVGEPIFERFALTDELELRWGAAPGEPPRLFLDQHNEHEHGRALIVIDEQAWAQLDERGWLTRPLETEIWQLWTDDAQHAVLDLVEFAGPHADLDTVEPIEHEGRPALRVSLRASSTGHPERTVDAPTPWRHGATVEIASASIVLDRATGLWRSAQIELRWRFEDSAGRELAGSVRFAGELEIPDTPPVIAPPAAFEPVPERERPELLRERMLDGLAAP